MALFSSFANANPYGFSKNSFFTFFESSYFTTKNNFDDSGNQVLLPANNKFTEYTFDIQAAFDFTDHFGIYSDLAFKAVDALTFPIDRTNTGFSDFSFGAQALLWSGFINVIPDFSVSIPLYPTPGSDVSALLGDGALTSTAKLYVSRSFKWFSLATYGGYMYRTQDLSAQIPWGFVGEFNISPFFCELQFAQSTSLGNDLYPANSPLRRSVTDRYDGGSFIYDSINPSSSIARARVGWNLAADLFITVGVEQILAGQRTAQGTRYLVGIGLADFLIKKNHKRASYPGEDVDQFKVDTGTEDPLETLTPEKRPSLVH